IVIINTSATDVSIHAVSPELGVHFSRTLPPQTGGAASCASAMSPNARQRSSVPKRAVTNSTSLWRAFVPDPIVSLLVARGVGESLCSRFVRLSGANANGALDWRNEDLAVAHLSGSCGILYRRNNPVCLLRGDHKINPDLRHKVHGILGAAINLRVSLLSAESLDLGHGHALHAENRQRAPHLVELEWLDNGGD